MRLTTKLHDRDAAGFTYVYPVVSRRARGVSVGINLNTNNACNWRCVYCQVPGLTRGKAPDVDLAVMRDELAIMLDAIVNGSFLTDHVPASSRRLNDVAFSGNGEPTSSPLFAEAVEVVRDVLGELKLPGELPVILITNGSLAHKPEVEEGLRALTGVNGRVWFKIDRATDTGIERVNDVKTGVERQLRNLISCSQACPTWIQSLFFARNGEAPGEPELEAYLEFLGRARDAGADIRGVLLYGLARRSYQPEAPELSPLPGEWLERFAARIRAGGTPVEVFL